MRMNNSAYAVIEPLELMAIQGGALIGFFPAAGSNIEKLIEPIQQRTSTPIIPILGSGGSGSNAPVA